MVGEMCRCCPSLPIVLAFARTTVNMFISALLVTAILPMGIGTGLAGFMLSGIGFAISWRRCVVLLIILADGWSLRFRMFVRLTLPPILLPVPKILEVALRFCLAREVGRRSRI